MRSLFGRKLANQQSTIAGPDPSFVVQDKLTEVDVLPHKIGQAGYPEKADYIAYSSVQRILAVSTADGQLQLYGGKGVSGTFEAGRASPTVDLEFSTNRSALFRLSEGGELQVWNLDTCKVVAQLSNDSDPICRMAVLANDPYVLLGCKSGKLRIVCLLDMSDEPLPTLKAVYAIRVQPYAVSTLQLGAHGRVTTLSVTSYSGNHYALAAHEDHSLRVWDLRGETICSMASPEDEQVLMLAGPAVCSCWIGGQAAMFATGHAAGYVLVWGIVPAKQDGETPQPELLLKIRSVPEGRASAPIRKLFPFGASTKQLLVLGGQTPDEPILLTLFSLASAKSLTDLDIPTPLESSGQSLHWFGPIQGAAAVAGKAAVSDSEEPVAALVLTEGGNLMLHDLSSFIPTPLELSFQGMSPVAATSWCQAWEGKSNEHSLVASVYRDVSARSVRSDAGQWSWVVAGGSEPDFSSSKSNSLYFTGHRDGTLRVWDMATAAPTLLFHIPSQSSGKAAQPNIIQACSASGLLCVTRGNSSVDLYQFCSSARDVRLATFSDTGEVTMSSSLQEPGFQKVLQWKSSGARILSMVLSSRHRLVLLGDEQGAVTFIDINKPAALPPLVTGIPSVAQMVLAYAVVTEASLKGSGKQGAPRAGGGGAIKLCLYVSATDSSLLAIDAETRVVLGKPLKPKTLSGGTLHVAALDLEAVPTTTSQRYISLPWTQAIPEAELHAEAGGAQGEQDDEEDDEEEDEEEDESNLPSTVQASVSGVSDGVPRASGDEDEDEEEGSLVSSRRSRGGAAPPSEDKLAADLASVELEQKTAFEASNYSSSSIGPGPDEEKTASEGEELKPKRSKKPSKKERIAAMQSYYSENTDNTMATTGSAPPTLSPYASANLSDVLEDETIPTMVAYITCVTPQHARTYYVDNVKNGDRTAIAKANFDDVAAFASTFDSASGPGLVVLTKKGVLQVYSLPTLVQLLSSPPDRFLGTCWNASADLSWLQELHTAALTPQGQMAIFGPYQEFIRLALVQGTPKPITVKGLVDWDQAEAASAAAAALAAAASALPPAVSVSRPKEEPKPAVEPPSLDHGPGRGLRPSTSQKKGFTGFLTGVVGKVLDEGTKVAGKITDGVEHALKDVADVARQGMTLVGVKEGDVAKKSLDEVFSQEPEPEGESGTLPGATSTSSFPASQSSASRPPRAASAAADRQDLLGNRSADSPSSSVDRERIAQAGKAVGPDGQPKARTAEEIKQAYGIKTKKAATLQNTMAENADLLAQRGEKLNKLAERTAAMQNDAMDFAATAKKMAEQESNKKWWQL